MRQSPLSFLIVLVLIAVAPTLLQGQLFEDIDDRLTIETIDPGTFFAEEAGRVDRLLARGPHRKNPQAAGRNLIQYRAARTPRARQPRQGPLFKNRHRSRPYRLTQATPAPAPAPLRRLTGPRYKNRSAKTGG
ncbi:hypothetical protein LEM8419_00492 [Neolewinella maritima]|uniref:Secreted protein n=1 Tax=Neolewinella maritima TaxID=1383882 RepID=A0ABM9AX21_9BACT|nr:hypothetical protein [Neolewinella maritima]CAH0999195.1 hypothetical protein LEM8419_00492 [Neolewinella maritima]